MFEHDYVNFPELTNEQMEQLQFSSPVVQITEDFDALVVKVHDGDTITLRVSFRDFDFPLRFAGIDAPEMNNGGEVSRDWLKNLIEGHNVRILIDPKNRVGKYGRLIGVVFYNGMSVNDELVNLGYAFVFGKKLESVVPKLDKLMNEAKIS